MNEIQGKTIKVDGRDVHYYTAGHGEPLVVIHGGGGDARTWGKNIIELSEKYTVYAPDLPGYGGSQPLDGNYYIPELSRVPRQLRQQPRPGEILPRGAFAWGAASRWTTPSNHPRK